MSILRFPSSLADEAQNGANHVRFEVNERQNDSVIQPYTIHLYQPIGFAASDSGNYGTLDQGPMGAGMKTVLAKIGIGGSGEGGQFTSSDLKAGAMMNTSLLQGIPGLDMIDRGARIAALQKGIAQNPHTAVTYEGHQLRTFQFDYKLISESDREARTIAKIVDIFRNYALPESTGALSIQYPAQFKIDFYRGGSVNKFMPKILMCHLTGLQVTYNSTSNSFHKDGAPIETDIALTFQETKTIVRQDIYGEEFEGIDDKFEIVNIPEDEKPEGEG